jgi:hypothetical protein
VVVSVNFAGIFDIVSLLAVGLLLRLVIIEAMGILGPGGNVYLDA